MHIGVDATCWHNNRGYGRHARALLRALLHTDRENQYTFLVDSVAESEPFPTRADIRPVAASRPTVLAAAANGRRGLGDMWRMSRALSNKAFDIVLFPTVYSYLPVLSRARKVVFVHDVIAEKFPHLTTPRRLSRFFWKAKTALGRWQADALVTVSEHSRRGLAEHFRIPQERIHVVGEASDPVFRRVSEPELQGRLEAYGISGTGRTIVYVGGFSPHKNLEMLVTVFSHLVGESDLQDLRLVLVGDYEKEVFHSYAGTIRRQVESLGLADRVIFTGYLPDEDLVMLLNCATVLALPSLLEGFGLPAVEAAACGCPVVATTASPLPELLGKGGCYMDPLDQAGWQLALARVLRSDTLRQEMRLAGIGAAGRLTWEAAGKQLQEVLNEVGAG